MKKLLLAASVFLIILFTSCDKNNNCVSTPLGQIGICIDSSLINDSLTCIEIYDPVCGCYSNTYDNYCISDKSGVTSYVSGEYCD